MLNKNKEKERIWWKNYKKTSPVWKKCNDRYLKSEKGKLSNKRRSKKYRQSEHGRLRIAKYEAKSMGLGFNLLYENIIDEKYCYHHINNNDVAAIPRYFHNAFEGRGITLEQHRFMIKGIIKQLYKNR